jgi:orotidine-5'-phosphate decarboxylase
LHFSSGDLRHAQSHWVPAYAGMTSKAHDGTIDMNFVTALKHRWSTANSLVCVGLDPEPAKFPAKFGDDPDAIFAFCRDIADATADYACCFKPQIAHFAAHGAEDALQQLIAHLHATHPGIPVILDAKRGDIGSTAGHYAAEAFDRYGADAVTANPYLGRDSVQPFLDRADKGVVILCHTSNPGARDFQELDVGGKPLYLRVAATVANKWNANGNCALVVGATFPEELAQVRMLVGDMPLLIPGVGAQGGDVAAVVRNGRSSDGSGLIVSSSRAILYASGGDDYAQAARNATKALCDEINRYR